jgi:hypothetical protein
MGSVHGGYAATLLDTVMGCAVHSWLKAGQGYTTLELKICLLPGTQRCERAGSRRGAPGFDRQTRRIRRG